MKRPSPSHIRFEPIPYEICSCSILLLRGLIRSKASWKVCRVCNHNIYRSQTSLPSKYFSPNEIQPPLVLCSLGWLQARMKNWNCQIISWVRNRFESNYNIFHRNIIYHRFFMKWKHDVYVYKGIFIISLQWGQQSLKCFHSSQILLLSHKVFIIMIFGFFLILSFDFLLQ